MTLSENSGEMLNITINGSPVKAEAGKTILEVAKDIGVDIPTLCYNPMLEAYGGCRLCVVEADLGRRKKIVTSCNYEIWEGLKVETDSQRVRRSRRMTIELLLARCPEVEFIKDLALKYGVHDPRFPLDHDDCLLCGLCVRICNERMGVGAASLVGRGAEAKMDTPYHIDSEVCITCGACVSICPAQTPRLKKISGREPIMQESEFELGLKARPNIYIPFAQALPNIPVIDRDNCVHFYNDACRACQDACPAGAIDYTQQDELIDLKVGAVILAPGFCAYDADQKPEMGLVKYPNVISSLQFERILSASGPFLGKVVRPSDKRKPDRIAFIQCIGSRERENNFCSSVCCMYAIKEAIIAREHEASITCSIFFMDIRAHGKGFDLYYERARELGIEFVRSRPFRVEEERDSRNLTLTYEGEDGGYNSREFDMLVLSTGLQPPKTSGEIAAKFGIETDCRGFALTRPFEPVSTTRDGIYVCGPFSEPKDIPETVVEASSAASCAMVALSESRGEDVTIFELPPERDITGEPPRIGIFVCHCGKNIGGVVDVPSVSNYAAGLPNVVYAEDNLYTCSSDTQAKIKDKIKEHGLNRVIVASCSPRTHEPLFQETLREAGLNPHLFEMANIRDQCSWVHMHEKVLATEKAKDLVRMAAAKVRLSQPVTSIRLPVNKRALIIGGGIAGLTSAVSIAGQGFETVLVEKSAGLGGNARELTTDLYGNDVASHLDALIKEAERNDLIQIMINSEIEHVDGFIGNFNTRIKTAGKNDYTEIEHGVALIATGAVASVPGEYLYGRNRNVKTILELSGEIDREDFIVPETAVFIQCVGSREDANMYCSRVCCRASIRNALKLKEKEEKTNIFILYRDIRTYGFSEEYYTLARERGINFIRYDLENKPEVSANGSGVSVKIYDSILKTGLNIKADLLVLASRIAPNPDNDELSKYFKVPLSSEKFFLESHVKLKPVDFATDGVFVCGLAHYPKNIRESISQAMAAGSRAVTVLSRDTIDAAGKVAVVRENRCSGCGACVQVCAYNAVSLDEERQLVTVNEALCKGCGACAASCRGGAISLRGFTDEQILTMLKNF
ncbi:MAG: FAD-dependent oxidoreductase [Spirochaetales bacterium]|nr:FAD-dependent oxidoreductase [Spirochaetales bacterium]